MKIAVVILSLCLCCTLSARPRRGKPPRRLPKNFTKPLLLEPNQPKTFKFVVPMAMTVRATIRASKSNKVVDLQQALYSPSLRLLAIERKSVLLYDIKRVEPGPARNFEYKLVVENPVRKFKGTISLHFYKAGEFTLGRGFQRFEEKYVVRPGNYTKFPLQIPCPGVIHARISAAKRKSVIAQITDSAGRIVAAKEAPGNFSLGYHITTAAFSGMSTYALRIKNSSRKETRVGKVSVRFEKHNPTAGKKTPVKRLVLKPKTQKTMYIHVDGPKLIYFRGRHPRKMRDRGKERLRIVQIKDPQGVTRYEHKSRLPIGVSYRVPSSLVGSGQWSIVLKNPANVTTMTLATYGVRP
jgi:hypothetical protein